MISKKKNKKKIVQIFVKSFFKIKHFLTVGDWISLVAVVCFCVVLFIVVISGTLRGNAVRVEILTDTGRFLYDINTTQTLELQGPVGTTKVRIDKEEVDVLSSPGRRQICVNAKNISKPGEWLACLPNKVFIYITGSVNSTKLEVDAFSF